MTYQVIVTPVAEAEAMEQFHWYAQQSEAVAERWYSGLKKTIASLAKRPILFPVSPEDSDDLGCEVRILLHGRKRGIYRILYTISGETVWVLRIRHSARGPLSGEVR